jgi:hypothetical protein
VATFVIRPGFLAVSRFEYQDLGPDGESSHDSYAIITEFARQLGTDGPAVSKS